jgi:hypothetical protein
MSEEQINEYKSRTIKNGSVLGSITLLSHPVQRAKLYRAQLFMDNITNYLNSENAKVLNFGLCRHSIYLNQLGFDVLGADLSEIVLPKQVKTQMTLCILKCMT